MISSRFALLALLGLVVVGCSTIRRARETQEAVAARGRGEKVVQGALPDFRRASLAQLVDFALTNRPSVVSARLEVEDARLALREIAADAPLVSETPWTAPRLSGSGSYYESSAGTRLGGGEGFRTTGKSTFSMSLEVLLYDFGRYDARAKAQGERVIAAEQALVSEGYSVFNEVTTSYFDLIQARSILDVALGSRDDYAEQLARVEARLEAGEAQQLDVLRAKVDLAGAAQEVVAASNEVQTAGAAFLYALGVDLSRGTARDILDLSPIELGTVYRAFSETDLSTGAAYDFARTNAPSMKVVRARLRAASRDVDYAIANLMPKVSASTTFSWTDPLWFWNWGVSAAQDLFQGFRKTAAVDRAVVAMRKAATEVEAGEQRLSSDLATAIAVRDNAAEALRTALASARSANENRSLVTAKYDVGEATRIDLSAAVSQHSIALGDCIKAFYYGQKAEAALYALLGNYPVYREERLSVSP